MTSRTPASAPCCFLPPYLLRQLAMDDTLAIDSDVRLLRSSTPPTTSAAMRTGGAAVGPAWVVHTAAAGSTLPGEVVRSAGEAESGDLAVDEAAYGIAGALALFAEVYGRSSYDDQGASVSLSVHYQRDYDNAFWDGTQLVFGDGDGTVFDRFTKPVDVLGHELTHAVTERTAALAYEGQSGALNESVSDVFAACLKQRLLGQSPTEADWLIGAGIFLPGVAARGLRDMAAPGTAYDDPKLGKDPQPAHMDDYVETTDDNGGVHLNSGIPNRAFQLAAVAVGGTTWEGAGRIWYDALTGAAVGARTDFAGFAAATVAAAGEHAAAVEQAWATVGVVAAASAPQPAPGVPAPGGTKVSVRRSGGFAGLSADGEIDLDLDNGQDERVGELRSLVERIDVAQVSGGDPQPDRYVYEFDLAGSTVRVPEQHLTPDLRRVADLLLP